MSTRIRSVNSFSFKYGTIEFEAKMPKGDWIWPAVWLLPKLVNLIKLTYLVLKIYIYTVLSRSNEYGQWPASGEIDILESRGYIKYFHIYFFLNET